MTRGGGFFFEAQLCRSAWRFLFEESDSHRFIGLRPRAGVTLP